MLLFEKFGQHQPLNRQAERYAREGVPLSLSTLADQVGACARAGADLRAHRGPCPGRRAAAWRRYDRAGAGQGQDRHRPLWIYVRDDRPFGGPAPPAAMFHYSRDRGGEHPQAHLADYAGILQADAYGGYASSTTPTGSRGRSRRRPVGPCPAQVLRAGRYRRECAAQGAGQDAGRDLAARRWRRSGASTPCSTSSATSTASRRRASGRSPGLSAPLVADLENWMREQRAKLSRHNDVAKAMDYMLKRWPASRASSTTAGSA